MKQSSFTWTNTQHDGILPVPPPARSPRSPLSPLGPLSPLWPGRTETLLSGGGWGQMAENWHACTAGWNMTGHTGAPHTLAPHLWGAIGGLPRVGWSVGGELKAILCEGLWLAWWWSDIKDTKGYPFISSQLYIRAPKRVPTLWREQSEIDQTTVNHSDYYALAYNFIYHTLSLIYKTEGLNQIGHTWENNIFLLKLVPLVSKEEVNKYILYNSVHTT